jgi:hypothetical protein
LGEQHPVVDQPEHLVGQVPGELGDEREAQPALPPSSGDSGYLLEQHLHLLDPLLGEELVRLLDKHLTGVGCLPSLVVRNQRNTHRVTARTVSIRLPSSSSASSPRMTPSPSAVTGSPSTSTVRDSVEQQEQIGAWISMPDHSLPALEPSEWRVDPDDGD